MTEKNSFVSVHCRLFYEELTGLQHLPAYAGLTGLRAPVRIRVIHRLVSRALSIRPRRVYDATIGLDFLFSLP